MFNFCDPVLMPVVTCSTICSEGYEVSNLISNDWSKRQKGFLAYRSIKPRIDITFGFICDINPSHVIIWPQVGLQKSSGFELLCSSKSTQEIPPSNRIQQQKTLKRDVINKFERVGRAFIGNETGVVFQIAGAPVPSHATNFFKSTMYKMDGMYNISSLRIRILKTERTSVPAIAKVEIWGTPGTSCSQDERTAVTLLWNSLLNENTPVNYSKQEANVNYNERSNSDAALSLMSHNEFKIPEEFLDPITCEMMVIPFILPCGKMIDQSTLEKHEHVEANWGRGPNDPYTGIVFTKVNRPIMAVALKARIDKFILEHMDKAEMQNIPRTVGRKHGLLESNISKNGSFRKRKHNSDLFISCNANESIVKLSKYTPRNTSNESMHKCNSSLSAMSKQVKKNKSALISVCEENKRARNITGGRSTTTSTQQSHEATLDESLNSALKSTLSSLPSFIKFDEIVPRNINCCAECQVTDTLFKLTCGHLLCRSCLVQKTKVKQLSCMICKAVFRSCDPVRYHV